MIGGIVSGADALGAAVLDLREASPGPMQLDPAAIVMPAGVVLDAVVAEHDAPWQLARLNVGHGDFGLWARDHGLQIGRAHV